MTLQAGVLNPGPQSGGLDLVLCPEGLGQLPGLTRLSLKRQGVNQHMLEDVGKMTGLRVRGGLGGGGEKDDLMQEVNHNTTGVEAWGWGGGGGSGGI